MNWREHIASDEEILLGKPTIKGTRVSVELILELLADGWSEKQILESYSNLKEKDLKAVYAYLKEGMENELFFHCLNGSDDIYSAELQQIFPCTRGNPFN